MTEGCCALHWTREKITPIFQKIYAQLGRRFFHFIAVGRSHLFHLSVNKRKPFFIKKQNFSFDVIALRVEEKLGTYFARKFLIG